MYEPSWFDDVGKGVALLAALLVFVGFCLGAAAVSVLVWWLC